MLFALFDFPIKEINANDVFSYLVMRNKKTCSGIAKTYDFCSHFDYQLFCEIYF